MSRSPTSSLKSPSICPTSIEMTTRAPGDVESEHSYRIIGRRGRRSRGGSQAHDNAWKRFTRYSADSWLWEIASMSVSVLGLIGMLVFVRESDGRNESTWPHFVTANTVLAIASTIVRATMIFAVASAIGQLKWFQLRAKQHTMRDIQAYDSATRGPWGAFKFFWQRKRLPLVSHTTLLGCLIMILAVIIDPMAQQSLAYTTTNVTIPAAQSSGAYIPTSHDYNFAGLNPGQRDDGMLQAFLGPLFNAPASIQHSCPSGHCRFQEFSTIGMDAGCADVTHRSKVTLTDEKSTDIPEPVKGTVDRTAGHLPGVKINVTGPSLPYALLGHFNRTMDMNSPAEYCQTNVIYPSTVDKNGLLGTVSVLRTIEHKHHQGKQKRSPKPADNVGQVVNVANTQFQVELWQCNVSLARYNFPSMSFKNGVFNHQTGSTQKLSFLRYVNGSNNAAGNTLVFGSNVISNRTGQVSKKNQFTINSKDLQYMQHVLASFNMRKGTRASILTESIQNSLRVPNDIPSKFGQIADSLTYHMMASSNQPSQRAGAIVWTSQSYWEARYVWLIPTIVLVTFSVFLLATVIFLSESESYRQPAWKSSLYPLLTLNLREGIPVDPEEVKPLSDWRLSQLEELCKGMRCQIFDRQRRRFGSYGMVRGDDDDAA